MLTIQEVKTAEGIYNIPKNIHINKDICLDWRLFDALVNPDYDGNRDYKYDFNVFLPTYGINLQRPYVWEHYQQNEFILSILLEKPIESFVIIQYNEERDRGNVTNYVIDGKQRLMTIQKFGKNEFPIIVDGKEYYFKDFSDELKMFFERRCSTLTAVVYYTYPDIPASDELKIKLFNFYNFSGTPQTDEHKKKLQSLLK